MTPAPAEAAGAVSNVVVTAPRPAHRSAFHELLSELNPLQYLPVVGTIYRAVTGDRIPEEARTVGSLVMSGITGGPAGVAISAAMMAVESLVGIDPEKLGQGLLAEVGIGGPTTAPATPPKAVEALSATKPSGAPQPSVAPAADPSAAPALSPGAAPAADPSAAPAPSPSVAPAMARATFWSPAQLAAYGVTVTHGGTLRRGSVEGADVLNDLELSRVAPRSSGNESPPA